MEKISQLGVRLSGCDVIIVTHSKKVSSAADEIFGMNDGKL